MYHSPRRRKPTFARTRSTDGAGVVAKDERPRRVARHLGVVDEQREQVARRRREEQHGRQRGRKPGREQRHRHPRAEAERAPAGREDRDPRAVARERQQQDRRRSRARASVARGRASAGRRRRRRSRARGPSCRSAGRTSGRRAAAGTTRRGHHRGRSRAGSAGAGSRRARGSPRRSRRARDRGASGRRRAGRAARRRAARRRAARRRARCSVTQAGLPVFSGSLARSSLRDRPGERSSQRGVVRRAADLEHSRLVVEPVGRPLDGSVEGRPYGQACESSEPSGDRTCQQRAHLHQRRARGSEPTPPDGQDSPV